MSFFLEIACFNRESAPIAAAGGADRIEFAADYASGGVTPDMDDFIWVKKSVAIPVYILIRSRPGNFVYAPEEVAEMKKSMDAFRSAGADGFVFGCLDKENRIDILATQELLHAAGALPCTFHRAFDRLADLQEGLEQIIRMGFQNILTSGGASSAIEGMNNLISLKHRAAGRICIMPGGGIRSGNISRLRDTFAGPWFHSAGITGNDPIADASEIKKMKEVR